MRVDKNGLDFIKSFEGLHDGDLSTIGLQPKMDPVGIWTSGWGHAIRDNNGNFIKGKGNKDLAYKYNKINNLTEADLELNNDLKIFEFILQKKIKIQLNQNQWNSMLSHIYNTGGSDTLFKLINKKAPEEQIRKWFETKYITSNGVRLNGLVRRRKAESDLFFK